LGPDHPGLEPGEQLLVRTPASFRGATGTSISATFALASAHKRIEAYRAWQMPADLVGFKTAGPEMVLGLTDRRLVIWKTTFWFSRVSEISGEVPFDRLHDVVAVRHGLVTSVAFAFTNGQIVEVEAMRGRRLRHLAAEMHARLT
jgi:hypothetical protein